MREDLEEKTIKCPKCRQKMTPIEGQIQISLGEIVLNCVSDAWRCDPCDINLAQLQVKVQPIKGVVLAPANPFEKIEEGEGHA